MFLKFYLHSIYLVLLDVVLMINILIIEGYVKENIRSSVKHKLHSSRYVLIKIYHSKSSENESGKMSKAKNNASKNVKIRCLNYLKSYTYLTNWCFNILTIIFQNFRQNIRNLTKFSFISKLVRKACDLSKMQKCSSFSRALPKSLLRMSRINFRFSQKCAFYSSFFAFLRKTRYRTTQKIISIDSQNYAVPGYQVISKLSKGVSSQKSTKHIKI